MSVLVILAVHGDPVPETILLVRGLHMKLTIDGLCEGVFITLWQNFLKLRTQQKKNILRSFEHVFNAEIFFSGETKKWTFKHTRSSKTFEPFPQTKMVWSEHDLLLHTHIMSFESCTSSNRPVLSFLHVRQQCHLCACGVGLPAAYLYTVQANRMQQAQRTYTTE